MPTKICIINVDLGTSIDDIIANEVEAITGAARKELDSAIDLAKTTKLIKEEKETAVKESNDKITNVLEKVYTKLIEAGDIGLAVSTVMVEVIDIIPNSSALTTRMKSLLSQKGNPHIIKRIKHHGTPHYVLVPFNAQETQDD